MVASGKACFYPSSLMLGLLRFFIRIYQCTLSPLLSLISGPGAGCRFKPTCSAYFLEAVETHGIAGGIWLGLKRLARCQPWGGAGYDPVPTAIPNPEGNGGQHVQHQTLNAE
jgi:putative membrane protein insertion efficiency factor